MPKNSSARNRNPRPAGGEGPAQLTARIKAALDHVTQVCLGERDLEFVWVGDDGVDPLQQAQTLNILVGAGIKTIAEARADLGLAAEAKAGPAPALGKFNPHHDERGRFATADGAGEPEESKIVCPDCWQACHEKCLATTEGIWPSSDRQAQYRQCVRECLGSAGDKY